MNPDLQRAFSVAYNENRLAGDAGGESVRLLREHDVRPETIDRILKEKHIEVVVT